MKMVMAIMPRSEAEGVLQALVGAEHTATFTETRGGMLRQAQKTLFIAVKDDDLQEVLGIIERSCHSRVTVETSESESAIPFGPTSVTTKVGGAVVFVWDLNRIEKY
ncbi:MAG: cyclic-di-AMP receptor [Chloroflexota bacterium]|nr:cyclic-di-AMP receptor [Chloroflexota bacterium]